MVTDRTTTTGLVVLAVIAAAVAGASALGGRAPRVSEAAPAPSGASLPASLCPPGSLPDDGVCIPVPSPEHVALRSGTDERIPRRPDRPAEYARYELPVARAASIAELGDRSGPDGGARPSGIGIQVEQGAQVSAIALDGQEGAARVVYEGPLWGPSIVTLHQVRVGTVTERYLVAIAGLGSLKPRAVDDDVSPGAVLGTMGSSELVLETRLLRAGVDLRGVASAALMTESTSIAIDPRNVLSSKGGP